MSVSTILFSHLSSLQTLTSELWDHQQMDGWIFSPAWCTALNKMSAEALSGRHHFFGRAGWSWTEVDGLCGYYHCVRPEQQTVPECVWQLHHRLGKWTICSVTVVIYTEQLSRGGSNQSISSQSLSANRQRPIYFVVFSVADGCAFWRAPNTAACL